MPYCPKCGKPVSDQVSFCASCGAALPAAVAAGGMEIAPPPPAGNPPPPPSPGSRPLPPQASAAGSPPLLPPGSAPRVPTLPVQGAPAPAAPVVIPPPPARQRMPKAWKVVLACLLAFVVAVLVIGMAVTVTVLLIVRAVKPPVDVTNRFLEAISGGDAEEAWDMLHPSYIKEEYSFSEFERDVADPLSDSLDSWNANESNISGSEARVGVDMVYSDGKKGRAIFYLRKSGDEWLITGWEKGSG